MAEPVVVFTGHRRSLATVALVNELLQNPSVTVAGVLCVREWSLSRLREWQRRFRGRLAERVVRELRSGPDRGARNSERGTYLAHVRRHGLPLHLPEYCRACGVPFQVVPHLNHVRTIRSVQRLEARTAVYSGGGILRQPLLKVLEGGVLNLHCAPLPHIRGMSGVEWSLYHGIHPTVTLHQIDQGIDTGRVFAERCLQVDRSESVGTLRARTVLAGIELLGERVEEIIAGRLKGAENPNDQGLQYFEMCEPLKRVVSGWLEAGLTPNVRPQDVQPGDLRTALERTRAESPT